MQRLALAVGCTALGATLPTIVAAVAKMLAADSDNMSKEETLRLREEIFCRAQSISYRNTEPLMALRARMQYVFDERGTRFLDTRNNVGHVGWQHPSVVRAIQAQSALCNANSRYLHPKRVSLAKLLLKRFPPKLCVVMFVNSGSEANDLALRLARQHTGHSDAVVVDHAYHGHTNATLSLSPYKYEHVGGESYKAQWVHKIACPDMYRGKHAEKPVADAAESYADEVRVACERAAARRTEGGGSAGVAAFFIESGMSVAGVILPPPGYLEAAYKHVHAAGGVCVADEVQVGFGRFGKHFWGFQQQGVVPDIVTMGKPFGNGFPLAAVVTTKAVSESFVNGLEYFNTFGGNPVACAAGLAVLQTIEREKLCEHACAVGGHLMSRLKSLMASRSGRLLGSIRGSGLFIGVELVRDRETKEPASAETSILCSRLKASPYHILTSIDGAHNNVIVIKPPMCFSLANADTLVNAMETLLPGITAADIAAYKHTPT